MEASIDQDRRSFSKIIQERRAALLKEPPIIESLYDTGRARMGDIYSKYHHTVDRPLQPLHAFDVRDVEWPTGAPISLCKDMMEVTNPYVLWIHNVSPSAVVKGLTVKQAFVEKGFHPSLFYGVEDRMMNTICAVSEGFGSIPLAYPSCLHYYNALYGLLQHTTFYALYCLRNGERENTSLKDLVRIHREPGFKCPLALRIIDLSRDKRDRAYGRGVWKDFKRIETLTKASEQDDTQAEVTSIDASLVAYQSSLYEKAAMEDLTDVDEPQPTPETRRYTSRRAFDDTCYIPQNTVAGESRSNMFLDLFALLLGPFGRLNFIKDTDDGALFLRRKAPEVCRFEFLFQRYMGSIEKLGFSVVQSKLKFYYEATLPFEGIAPNSQYYWGFYVSRVTTDDYTISNTPFAEFLYSEPGISALRVGDEEEVEVEETDPNAVGGGAKVKAKARKNDEDEPVDFNEVVKKAIREGNFNEENEALLMKRVLLPYCAHHKIVARRLSRAKIIETIQKHWSRGK